MWKSLVEQICPRNQISIEIVIFNIQLKFLFLFSVPFSIQHKALKSTTFRDYNFPAENTNIMANIYGAHMDPRVFPNPEEFRPSRFFNDKGEYIKSDAVIPFSMGKFRHYSVHRLSQKKIIISNSYTLDRTNLHEWLKVYKTTRFWGKFLVMKFTHTIWE